MTLKKEALAMQENFLSKVEQRDGKYYYPSLFFTIEIILKNNNLAFFVRRKGTQRLVFQTYDLSYLNIMLLAPIVANAQNEDELLVLFNLLI